MRLQALLMGVILASLFMGVLGIFMGDVADKYSITYENNTQIYNKLNESYNEALEVQNNLNSSTEIESGFDVLGSLVDRGISAVKLTYGSAGNAIGITNSASDEIGLPPIVKLAMGSIILTFILIILVKIYLRSDV